MVASDRRAPPQVKREARAEAEKNAGAAEALRGTFVRASSVSDADADADADSPQARLSSAVLLQRFMARLRKLQASGKGALGKELQGWPKAFERARGEAAAAGDEAAAAVELLQFVRQFQTRTAERCAADPQVGATWS